MKDYLLISQDGQPVGVIVPAPLPPLKLSSDPLSEEDRLQIAREERSSHITQLLFEDIEVLPYLIKNVLDKIDPNKTARLIKIGFEKKVAEMQQVHTELQSRLYDEHQKEKISQSEMLIRIKNSELSIHSMKLLGGL